jgi:hypothetical protein
LVSGSLATIFRRPQNRSSKKMAFATYWVHVFSPLNRKLKNGIHLVEAEEWRQGWWRVRTPGAQRSQYISPRIWNANRAIPYTGQPFGLAMQELHQLEKDAKNGTPKDAVCPVAVDASPGEVARASAIRPDRLHRPRRVRKNWHKKV